MNLLRFAHAYNGAQMAILTAAIRRYVSALPAPRMGNDCGICGQPHSSHCNDCGKCPPGHYTWCET